MHEARINMFVANFAFHYLHVTYCSTSVRNTVAYSPHFTNVQLNNFHVPQAGLESATPVFERSDLVSPHVLALRPVPWTGCSLVKRSNIVLFVRISVCACVRARVRCLFLHERLK